jgi:hypothetical protein
MCCAGPVRVMKSEFKDVPERDGGDGRRVHGLPVVQLLMKNLGVWDVENGRKTA